MDRLLPFIFDSFVQSGTLRVTTARGRTFTLGDGTGTPIAVRFTSRGAQWAVLLDPELRLGEAYMNGTFVIEQGSIADLLALTMASDAWNTPSSWLRPHWLIRYVWRRLQQFNPPRRARRNVAHHYDLDSSLYSLSSTPTGNTAAPISRASINRSTTRSWQKSAISPRSCSLARSKGCSTSVPAGAAWRCISRRHAARG